MIDIQDREAANSTDILSDVVLVLRFPGVRNGEYWTKPECQRIVCNPPPPAPADQRVGPEFIEDSTSEETVIAALVYVDRRGGRGSGTSTLFILRAKTILKYLSHSSTSLASPTDSAPVILWSEWAFEARAFDVISVIDVCSSVVTICLWDDHSMVQRGPRGKQITCCDFDTSFSIARDVSACQTSTSHSLITGETYIMDPELWMSPVVSKLPYRRSEFKAVLQTGDAVFLGQDYIAVVRWGTPSPNYRYFIIYRNIALSLTFRVAWKFILYIKRYNCYRHD